MAYDWTEKSLTPRQYLEWNNLPSNRYSDEILKEWFYIMRELRTKNTSSLEILYDLSH